MMTGFRNVTPCSSVGCDQRLAAACCLWRQQTLATSTNLHGATSITICRETLRLCLPQYHLFPSIFYICYSSLSFFVYSFLSILNSLLSSLLFSNPPLFLFYLSVYLFVSPSFIITPFLHSTHMLLIEAHICIKGLSLSHPNTAAGIVRGVNFYKGWFIRETLVCCLKLILHQKFSLPLATRLMKLRPPLIKSVWVTVEVQSGMCRSCMLLYSYS